MTSRHNEPKNDSVSIASMPPASSRMGFIEGSQLVASEQVQRGTGLKNAASMDVRRWPITACASSSVRTEIV